MACSAAVRVPANASEAAHQAIDLVIARLDCTALAVEKGLSLLLDDEVERANRFLVEKERNRFIVARATLRRLLAERLGVSPRAVRLARGTHGKPALAWPLSESGLHFNVSHSQNLAAYAFSHGREIGIDVEAVRPMPDAEDVARRFFSRNERTAFFSLDPVDRCLAFFHCWTRKEAFIKAIGDGLSHPLSAFDVTLKPGEAPRLLRVGDRPGERSGWSLGEFDPGAGFVGAFVVRES
ncbi:MAG TPA: 4'-phosphopantetheinyl transferase superfamily protein [Burkholderiales bacterium]|nr:4'-phosphopantetheinyl transferase superfamily protein [Burkholderiales bacterium]